jgi:hypothetical protein
VVNAPVAPDVIYVARGTGTPGISVIDLNGFGMGTGNPAYDPANPVQEGNSNAPNNPNIAFQGASLIPPLTPGQCTINGGSSGVFTLARDSNLNNLLISPPLIDSVGAMTLGQPLDLAINNSPPPFGCQSGNPNVCAISGLKVPTPVVQSASTLAPAQPGQFSTVPPGTGNLISWAPHPNPPPLVFPPLCISPNIGGQEPTSIDTPVSNLLLPGNPFGNPAINLPPTGLLANEQNTYFVGPSSAQDSPGGCTQYSIRQQVGHFLYVVDRVRRQLVVLNSNRFTVLDRIDLPDPTELAMSPNLDFLAVSNQTAGVVSFIDVNPLSATFHQVVQTVKVGAGPRGIAWQPDNEDIFVCNEQEGSVTILRALDFQPRKVLKGNLQQPFAVVLAPRQVAGGHGLQRQTYFGFILGRNGRLSLYQSGPSGINALGQDDIIASAPATFQNPKGLALDRTDLRGGVWIVHENPLNPATGLPKGLFGGAVTNVVLNGLIGVFPPGAIGGGGGQGLLTLEITASIGPRDPDGYPGGHRLRQPGEPGWSGQSLQHLLVGHPRAGERQERVPPAPGHRSGAGACAAVHVPGGAQLEPGRRRRGRGQPELGSAAHRHQPLPTRGAIDPGAWCHGFDGLLQAVVRSRARDRRLPSARVAPAPVPMREPGRAHPIAGLSVRCPDRFCSVRGPPAAPAPCPTRTRSVRCSPASPGATTCSIVCCRRASTSVGGGEPCGARRPCWVPWPIGGPWTWPVGPVI